MGQNWICQVWAAVSCTHHLHNIGVEGYFGGCALRWPVEPSLCHRFYSQTASRYNREANFSSDGAFGLRSNVRFQWGVCFISHPFTVGTVEPSFPAMTLIDSPPRRIATAVFWRFRSSRFADVCAHVGEQCFACHALLTKTLPQF